MMEAMESLESYLDRLASDAAVPGGGSAAAVSGAMAAALVAMVARIARRNPRNAANAEALDAIADHSDELRATLSEARSLDEAAYAAVVEAQAMPKDTADQQRDRRQALDDALARAAEEPLRSAQLNLELLTVAARLLEYPVDALTSDIGSAAELAAGALASCAYNVTVNHRYMKDAGIVALQREALTEIRTHADALLTQIRETVGSRLAS
jgi:formiminotetrahydrofolate cyclodeaminase